MLSTPLTLTRYSGTISLTYFEMLLLSFYTVYRLSHYTEAAKELLESSRHRS